MKNLTAILLLVVSIKALAQKEITICHPEPTEKFAALASSETFKNAHLTPKTYNHVSAEGKEISFKTPDGSMAYGYFFKAKSSTKKFLFVFHEWYGLNDYVKKESEKLFHDLENVNVLAIDLYDKRLATNSEEASTLMRQVKTERARAIIEGASAFAGENAQISTIGWCFGGGWSLQAALQLKEKSQACVIYYGMPELDVEKLKKLDCEVLGIFASRDQMITPQIVEQFAQKMDEAESDLTYKVFDAVHAFANPSNPDYNSEATKEAYTMTLQFLKREM